MIGHDKILGTLMQQMAGTCSHDPSNRIGCRRHRHRPVDEPETCRAVTKRACRTMDKPFSSIQFVVCSLQQMVKNLKPASTNSVLQTIE